LQKLEANFAKGLPFWRAAQDFIDAQVRAQRAEEEERRVKALVGPGMTTVRESVDGGGSFRGWVGSGPRTRAQSVFIARRDDKVD
jgi:hypothetical protein